MTGTPHPLNEIPPGVEELAAAFEEAGRGLVVVVTGAGVSAASGIPTFRGTDPNAIWNRDVTEIGTCAYFERDPAGWWQWYLDRFAAMATARPNPAHQALAALETWQTGRGGEILLITQNLDVLHDLAGSRRLVHVHGRADRLRCARYGCELGAPAGSLAFDRELFADFLAAPQRSALPRCARCGTLLRAHALLFDEMYDEHADYGFARVRDAAERMALVLFVGTSFSVGVTELLLRAALGWRVPAFSIDPGAAPPHREVRALRAPAEELLPALCRRLGADRSSC